MAGTGPKISIGIDDTVQQKVQQLDAALKQAKKEVRELEKEAKKALESTGKVSEFALKRIDEAKRRAADINSQLRGARALGPRPEIIRSRDDRPTAGEAMKNLKDLFGGDGLKDYGRQLKSTRLGGAFQNISNFARAGAVGAVAAPVAGFGLFATAVFRSADRNLEAENLERSIRSGKLQGQDTELLRMRLERSKIDNATGFKVARDVAGLAGEISPILGRIVGAAGNFWNKAANIYNGTDDFSLARKELEKSDVSFREYRRAQVDADGNSIKTLFMDKLEGMSPEPLRKFLAGSREQETLAKVKENRDQKAKYEAQGYALIETNNFGAAQDAFNNAAHFGANKAIDAVQAWQQNEASIRARLEYEKTQRKVPAFRMGM